jgi:cell division protein FtsB
MPENPNPLDFTNVHVTFSLKMFLVIITTLITLIGGGYGAYYGITSRISSVDTAVKAQTQSTDELRAEIKTLTERNDALKQQMLELTITLRTKGVIK